MSCHAMYKEVRGWQGSQRREKEKKRRIEKIDRTFDRQTLCRESFKFLRGVGWEEKNRWESWSVSEERLVKSSQTGQSKVLRDSN